ncbi:hypothetical protein RJ640_025987 [Escallonia rubra]|uniref:Protein kinase domain-containing protein n=1 Tax=Escallonia rubra TaxID=112253 RepID=A0AA88QP12_9ASTE|nr:hypothetical protein RJ640_025987 [Escallonia rubra]
MTSVCVLIRHRKSKRAEHELDLQPTTLHRRISYHELLVATNGFSESNLVGSGSFGSVYRGVLSDGIVVAIKVIRLDQEKALKSFETEYEVIRNIRRRNLRKSGVYAEYGFEGSVSTWCDVYSNGIMLMELLTRKPPTNDMFAGDTSLKRRVKESLPDTIAEVIDANFLGQESEHYSASWRVDLPSWC